MNTFSRRHLLGVGIAAAASLSGCLGFSVSGEASESVDRSFPASAVEAVQITNPVGHVSVVAAARDDVRVEVLSRARDQAAIEDLNLRIDLVDGTLAIETSLPDSSPQNLDSASSQVTVTVPDDDSTPVVESVASLVGNVSLSDTSGDTIVHAEVGEVSATDVTGFLSLSTSVGTVTASDATGLDRATTEVGDVKVDLLGVRRDVDIGSEVGDVVVGVAEDLPLSVVAESEAGVDSDLLLEELVENGTRLSGLLNGGGHRLWAHSDIGEVSLRTIRRAD